VVGPVIWLEVEPSRDTLAAALVEAADAPPVFTPAEPVPLTPSRQ
jgi:hypothetical protein